MKRRALQFYLFIAFLVPVNFIHAVIVWTSLPSQPGTASFSIGADDNAPPGDTWEDEWRTITLYKNGAYLGSVTVFADWVSFSMQTTAGINTQFAAEGDGYITGIVNADIQPPTVPTSLTASNKTETSFLLSWAASTDNYSGVTYNIKRDSTIAGDTGATSWNFTGLQPGVLYTVYVRAYDSGLNLSNWSAPISVTLTDTNPPSAPTNLAYTSITPSFVSLTWTAATDAVGVAQYKIYRTIGGIVNEIGATQALNFTDFNVTPEAGYIYAIRAFDASGNYSAYSNQVVVNVPMVGDNDADGVPDSLEVLFGSQSNPNPTTDAGLLLKPHRPLP